MKFTGQDYRIGTTPVLTSVLLINSVNIGVPIRVILNSAHSAIKR